MSYLSLNDLFLVGLALDISGAVLLAKGLLLTPRTMARLKTWWWVETGNHEDRLQNRVAGEFGTIYLGAGFVFQALGYALEIGGLHSDTGFWRLLAALGMSAVATGLAWMTWALLHKPRLGALANAVEAERETAQHEIEEEGAWVGHLPGQKEPPQLRGCLGQRHRADIEAIASRAFRKVGGAKGVPLTPARLR